MRLKLVGRLALLTLLWVTHADQLLAQNFSFNCTRDTVIPGCATTSCFNLTTVVPNLFESSDNYTVSRISPATIGCMPVYSSPAITGSSTNLTSDDKYSNAIPIGFPFQFYGVTYNSLLVSTNGVITFDLSRANGAAHFGIIRTNQGTLGPSTGQPEDLPSTLYDPSIIMGPYSDVDITIPSSPTRRIQYTTVGAAPNRKWILSFYKLPLYSDDGSCSPLYENTSQIILNEGTNIIQVLIFSKENCTSWNQGRALIGIQNAGRDKAVMAKGRAASSAPWGTGVMNEGWQFVPSQGSSLLKSIDLLSAGGLLLDRLFPGSPNITTLPNGTLQATFQNVCPPAGATTSYFIKSVYSKFDDPTQEVFGIDTVRAIRSAALDLGATAVTTESACGAIGTGSITVSVPAGVGTGALQYSINGTTFQPGAVFNNVIAGNYTVNVRDQSGCASNISAVVASDGKLAATATTTPSTCLGAFNGTITLVAAGAPVLEYRINTNGTGPWTTGNNINGLQAGQYLVEVRDKANPTCIANLTPVVALGATAVTGTAIATHTACPGVNNGGITITAGTGGPYEYSLNGTTWQTSSTFSNLASGPYTAYIREAGVCQSTPINVTVADGNGIVATLAPTSTSCNGVNNGSISVTPSNGTGPFTVVLSNATTLTGNAPIIFNGLAAGNYSVTITDNAGCKTAAPLPVTINAGTGFTAAATSKAASCATVNDASVTVTIANVTTGNYMYTLNGVTVLTGGPSITFSNLGARADNSIFIRDAAGCTFQLDNIATTSPPVLAATSQLLPANCSGEATGKITITASGGTAPYTYSLNGGAYSATSVFPVAASSNAVTIRDANNCTLTLSNLIITQPTPLIASIGSITNATCNGGNDGQITVNASGANNAYQYSLDNVNFQGGNVLNAGPGTYQVYVRDVKGCTASISNVIVGLTNNLFITPMIDPTAVCEGQGAQLQATSNAVSYSWSPATGLSNPAIANPVARPKVDTRYTVTATLGQCETTSDVNVAVLPAPIPNAGPDGEICFGQGYQLEGSGGASYSWSPATNLNNTVIADPKLINPPKTAVYSLSVVGVNGCPSLVTDEVIITVTPPYTIKVLPADTVISVGSSFQFKISSPATSYVWSPSTGLDDNRSPNPVFTAIGLANKIEYRVVGTTDAGCRGEATVTIRVFNGPEIYMANAFSPNRDGKNETFRPFTVGISKLNYFRVFNRWGQLLFSTSTLMAGWDGTFAGVEQDTGVYTYLVQAVTEKGEIINKRGTVTLVR